MKFPYGTKWRKLPFRVAISLGEGGRRRKKRRKEEERRDERKKKGRRFFELDRSPPLGIREFSAENHDGGPVGLEDNLCAESSKEIVSRRKIPHMHIGELV